MDNVVVSTDGQTVGAKLTGSAGAIVATEKETALFVNDEYLDEKQAPPHLARLNLAMLFIDALEHSPNWFARGLKIIQELKSEPK